MTGVAVHYSSMWLAGIALFMLLGMAYILIRNLNRRKANQRP